MNKHGAYLLALQGQREVAMTNKTSEEEKGIGGSCLGSSSSTFMGSNSKGPNGDEIAVVGFLPSRLSFHFKSMMTELGIPLDFGKKARGALVEVQFDHRRDAQHLPSLAGDVVGVEVRRILHRLLTKRPDTFLNYKSGKKHTVGSFGITRTQKGRVFLPTRVNNRPPKEGNYFNLECQGGGLWISLVDVERLCLKLHVTVSGVALEAPPIAQGCKKKDVEVCPYRRKLEFGDVITISVGEGGGKGVCDLLFLAAPPKPKKKKNGNAKKIKDDEEWVDLYVPPDREDVVIRDHAVDVEEDYEYRNRF